MESLLSLIPPSHMVIPNRDLGNKQQFSFSLAFITSTSQMAQFSILGLVMNINDVDNFNDIRKRSPSSSKVISRSLFVSLSTSSIPYHKRMVINNDLPDEELKEPIDSS